MTVLITGDLQLSESPRDEYRWVFLEKTLPDLINKEHADTLYILGDLCEGKDNHGSRLVNRLVDNLADLSRQADIVILQGNHDYREEGWPFFRFVDNVSHITWIDKPKEIGRWLFLPHTLDYQRDWEGYKLNKYDRVFMHNIVGGLTSSTGHGLTGIPIEVFKGARVISGDVHEPQTVGPVTYTGSPYRVDFGDDFEPRVLLLDGEAGPKPISIPVPGPQKRLLGVRDNTVSGTYAKGDIVKVRVGIKQSEYARWTEIRDGWRHWGEQKGLIVQTVEPVIIDAADTAKKRHSDNKRRHSDAEIFAAYVRSTGTDSETMKVGEKLL